MIRLSSPAIILSCSLFALALPGCSGSSDQDADQTNTGTVTSEASEAKAETEEEDRRPHRRLCRRRFIGRRPLWCLQHR